MLIYDGDCGFCTSSAALARKLGRDSFVVEQWQSLDLDELGLSVENVSTAVYWRNDDGELFRGHEGIGQALKQCSFPLTLVGQAMFIPPISWVAKSTYYLIAKYRYKLPGSTDACRLK